MGENDRILKRSCYVERLAFLRLINLGGSYASSTHLEKLADENWRGCRNHNVCPWIERIGARECRPVRHIELVKSNPKQWAETAIFVTVDEGGGHYDSGFIRPVDFFGTGPRIPMIAVSPFSRGGHVSHVYNEHSSFVKFIERNWKLSGTLCDRSRDNLPNPLQDDDNDYVPR
jgi:hypothetical protein